MRFAEAAALGEGGVAEVVGFDGEAGGDVVAHQIQPGALIGGEGGAGGGLLREPAIEAGLDGVGEGFEDGLLFEGETHEGDQVGEAADAGSVTSDL